MNEKVKNFILLTIAKQGRVVNTVVANCVAKALIYSLIFAKSNFLFKRMKFVEHASTTGKVKISKVLGNEVASPFHHEIIRYGEKYETLESLNS